MLKIREILKVKYNIKIYYGLKKPFIPYIIKINIKNNNKNKIIKIK